jgi:hypothetical protein
MNPLRVPVALLCSSTGVAHGRFQRVVGALRGVPVLKAEGDVRTSGAHCASPPGGCLQPGWTCWASRRRSTECNTTRAGGAESTFVSFVDVGSPRGDIRRVAGFATRQRSDSEHHECHTGTDEEQQ